MMVTVKPVPVRDAVTVVITGAAGLIRMVWRGAGDGVTSRPAACNCAAIVMSARDAAGLHADVAGSVQGPGGHGDARGPSPAGKDDRGIVRRPHPERTSV